MANRLRSDIQVCSFCKRTQEEVNRLIAGPDQVFICDECVDLCRDILDEDTSAQTATEFQLNRIPSPKEIYERLNEWVVGQDWAKKVLSVAVYNHYKRINRSASNKEDDNRLWQNSVGPDLGQNFRRAFLHRRCNCPHRSRLRWRRCRKHLAAPDSGG